MTDDVDLGVSWGKTDPAETPGNWRDQAHILELTDRKAQELTRLENTLAAALQALGELAAQAKAAGISEDRMLREVPPGVPPAGQPGARRARPGGRPRGVPGTGEAGRHPF